MRRLLLFAAGIALMLFTAFPTQQLNAQLIGEFDGVTTRINPYITLVDDVEIESTKFGFPPNYQMDLDDGYAVVVLDQFPFSFNGEVYNQVWINVNGFITFGKKVGNTLFPPPNLPAGSREPRGLFWEGASYPVNLIAPFWGDHRYRPEGDKFFGYAPTRISYKSESDKFTIQWKDLNVNFNRFGDPYYRASVADFQLILYKSTDPLSDQGNIEFRYGQIGKRPYQESFWDPTYDDRFISTGVAVGLKGEATLIGQQADFINALYNGGGNIPYNPVHARTQETLTNEWSPAGNPAFSILLVADTRFNVNDWWGDGDVDFSKAYGREHYQKPQNRFVTINDARLIMKSIATGIPLDPVIRRAAYHADVNHNGRYYINNASQKIDIPWRDMFYADNLPNEVSSLKQILFQANEYDAALIIAYISGRIPSLPWLLDTFPLYGKVNDEVATARFGEFIKLNNNTYQMPIYLDAIHKGALGMKFDINARILSAVANEQDNQILIVMNELGKETVVIGGNGQFNAATPIAYVTFASEDENVDITGIRYNDREMEDVRRKLTSIYDDFDSQIMLQNVPNPVVNATNISLNLPAQSHYILAIYDVQGNVVKNLANGFLNAGMHNFDWNATDLSGNKVENGVYFYRLTGNGETITKKMVVSR